jgi:hypothetical protein
MSELFSGIMVLGWGIFIFNYFRKKHLKSIADLQVKLDSDPKFKEEHEKKKDRFQRMHKEIKNAMPCEYLGGHPAEADTQSGALICLQEGIIFFKSSEKEFLIPWNEISDVTEVIEKTEEMSNMGNMAQGLGLMSVGGQGGIKQGIAANALIMASTTMKSTKQDDYLYLQYECSGIKGVALFKFKKNFSDKRPAAKAISIINKHRIQNRSAA